MPIAFGNSEKRALFVVFYSSKIHVIVVCGGTIAKFSLSRARKI
jgi:hypothetical protein